MSSVTGMEVAEWHVEREKAVKRALDAYLFAEPIGLVFESSRSRADRAVEVTTG